MGRITGFLRRGAAFAVVVALAGATAASGATPTHSWAETTSPHVSGNASEIYAMVATGTNDVWAFGYDRANIAGTFEWRVLGERWNGSTWTRLNTLDRETAPAHDFIYGATASGPSDVWIVGHSDTAVANQTSRNLVEHWNGAVWSIDNSVPDPGLRRGLLAASADSAADVWAVGYVTTGDGPDYNAQVLHRANGTWAQVPFTLTVPGCNQHARGELDAVDAISATDVYVSGWCQSQPIGRERGFVAHWNGASWSLALRADGASELTELATAPNGDIWVAGSTHFRGDNDAVYPLVFHGNATDGFTAVPVRHSPHFGGTVDSLTVTNVGVVIAGQLTDPRTNPSQTYALRLRASDNTWVQEPIHPTAGGYARIHAAAAEAGGQLWVGGTTVGGPSLDVQAFMAKRVQTNVCKAASSRPLC